MVDAFDVIVIGGGSTGENVAGRAVGNGLSAALIESELVGGECSYWACMPSKALLRPGEALAAVRRVPGARNAVTGRIAAEQALARRDDFTSHWDDKYQVKWVEDTGITLYRGFGRLTGVRTVQVQTSAGGTVDLHARKAVVIATGSSAAMPPIPGLAEAGPWDNRKITSAHSVPRRLAILGAGPVGAEMAQAWKWLGTEEVTLIERADRVLPGEEPFAGAFLKDEFASMGIDVRTSANVTEVARNGAAVTITLDGGSRVVADEIVVATGRRPVTERLGVESVGLKAGAWLETGDTLRVKGVPGGWLYACGDVNGRALLTHMGKYQARIAADVIAGKEVSAWADHTAVPRVVFTDPQVAAVGLTAEQARSAGFTVRTVDYGFAASSGGALMGEGIKGNCEIVVDEERRTIVGATFVGPGAGEMIHAATIALVGEVTLDQLWHAVPSYPTVSEFWLGLLESYGL